MNRGTLLGIFVAAAAGVAIGMLLAPEKGSDLRKLIKDSLGDAGDKLSDFIAMGKDKAEDIYDDVSEQARGLKKDVKNRYDNTKEAFS